MPGTSTCRECGDAIFWVRSDKGRTLPPLQKMGKMVVVVLDGVGITTPAYEKHYCDEKRAKAYARRMVEEAEAAERRRARWAEEREQQRQENRERQERWEEVEAAAALFQEATQRLTMGYECPKCGVAAQAPCENLLERKKGNVVPTKAPHADRINLIPKSKRPYWKDQFTVIVP